MAFQYNGGSADEQEYQSGRPTSRQPAPRTTDITPRREPGRPARTQGRGVPEWNGETDGDSYRGRGGRRRSVGGGGFNPGPVFSILLKILLVAAVIGGLIALIWVFRDEITQVLAMVIAYAIVILVLWLIVKGIIRSLFGRW